MRFWTMKNISCQEGKKIDKRNVIFVFKPWKALVAKRGGGKIDKRNVIFIFDPWKALVAKRRGEGKIDKRNVILLVNHEKH